VLFLHIPSCVCVCVCMKLCLLCVCDGTSGHICLHISLGIQICVEVMHMKHCLIWLFIDLVWSVYSKIFVYFLLYFKLLLIFLHSHLCFCVQIERTELAHPTFTILLHPSKITSSDKLKNFVRYPVHFWYIFFKSDRRSSLLWSQKKWLNWINNTESSQIGLTSLHCVILFWKMNIVRQKGCCEV
jgi:hypothetical protein